VGYAIGEIKSLRECINLYELLTIIIFLLKSKRKSILFYRILYVKIGKEYWKTKIINF